MLSFGFSPAGSSRSLCVACGGTRQSQAADPSSLMREEMFWWVAMNLQVHGISYKRRRDCLFCVGHLLI